MPRVGRKVYDDIFSKVYGDLVDIALDNENSIEPRAIVELVEDGFENYGFSLSKVENEVNQMVAELTTRLIERGYIVL